LQHLLADFTTALRQLRRAPGFALIAAGLLTIGLGAVITIYSLVHSILLQPLPYPEPNRLVGFRALNQAKAIDQPGMSPADFKDIAARATSFSTAGAYRPDFATYLPDHATPVQFITGLVTEDLFETFGVRPLLGRTFNTAEFSAAAERTVVLSEVTWRNQFAARTDILGTVLTINDVPHTVIGVMPASFREPAFVDIWQPFPRESGEYFARDSRYWNAIGRLAPGVTAASAHAEVAGLAADLARSYPDTNSDWSAAISPLLEQRTGSIRTSLLLLFGAVALILLIVCANLANLLLVRNVVKLPELGVRLALGSTPIRLARVVLGESLALALLGGGLGTALAAGLLPVVAERIPPVLLPRAHEAGLQPAAVAVGLGAALLAAVLCAALPAWQLLRADVNQWLKAGDSRGATRSGLGRWQSWLVSGQVALTVTVLAAALLLMQSLVRLQNVPPGFDPGNVLLLQLSPPTTRYETNAELVRYYEDLIDAVETVPGVTAATLNASTPLTGITLSFPRWRAGTTTDSDQALEAVYAPVTESYFQVMRQPLHAGRTFTEHDDANAAPVAIVNETYARRMFPGGDALGQRVMLMPWMGGQYREIVGIVGDTRQTNLAEPPPPQIYVPQRQMPWFFTTLLVRLDSRAAFGSVAAKLREADPTMPVSPSLLTETIAQGATQQRLYALLFAGFATLALAVSAFGLYASLRFALAQRMREIGVRVALGATAGNIMGLILGHAGRLAGIGVLAGVLAGVLVALPITFALRGQLYGIGPSDPQTYLLLTGLVALIVTATALPLARRTARVPPATILHST